MANQIVDRFTSYNKSGVRSPQEAVHLARQLGLPRNVGEQIWGVMDTAAGDPRIRNVTGGGIRGLMDFSNMHHGAKSNLDKARRIESVVRPMIDERRLNMKPFGRIMEDLATPGGPKGFMNMLRHYAGVVPKSELGPMSNQVRGIIEGQPQGPVFQGRGAPQAAQTQSPTPQPITRPGSGKMEPEGWRDIMNRTSGIQEYEPGKPSFPTSAKPEQYMT